MRGINAQRHSYGVACLLCVALCVGLAPVPAPPVLAGATSALARCAGSQEITTGSLLVVLLDRSGSLLAQPGATDPNGYSTSVTKALADLWPGMMAVIPFSNDRTPVWGPYRLADPAQRTTLKNELQAYPVGGDTPLAPALLAAAGLLSHAPGGSRVIIVTDGSPDPQILAGVNQIDEIKRALPQLCSLGVPVSTFGLTLDVTRPDGQRANQLLADIASSTGGSYVNVQSAAHLAQVVVALFSQWLHLSFMPVQHSAGRYTVAIDTYAKRVIFVAFRSNDTYAIVLKGPDAQPLPAQVVQRSTDRHYEIDNLLVSTVNQPGLYSIDMHGDPSAQVYALVETDLHAVLLQPEPHTTAYINQPLTLEARLVNGSTPIIPRPDEAILTVDVRILVQGQVVFHTIVELVQVSNSSLFSRQLTLPGPVGQVHVQVVASYLQMPVDATTAQISFPLQQAPTVGQGPVCILSASCAWLFSPVTSLGGISGLFLLLALFLFLLARKPDGWLLSQNGQLRDLGNVRRPLWRTMLSRSSLSSQELENQFDFGGAHFILLFKRELHLLVVNDEKNVSLQRGTRMIDLKEGEKLVVIEDNDVLLIEKCAPICFKQKE